MGTGRTRRASKATPRVDAAGLARPDAPSMSDSSTALLEVSSEVWFGAR